MAYFFVYETVDFPLQLSYKDSEGKVLENYSEVIVSLKQGKTILEKNSQTLGIDVENDIINLHLSQEETALFKANTQVMLQVNILYETTERDTSFEEFIDVYDNVHKEIMNDEWL